jgi:hypothetical protein
MPKKTPRIQTTEALRSEIPEGMMGKQISVEVIGMDTIV